MSLTIDYGSLKGGYFVDRSLLFEIEKCREEMILQSQLNDFTSEEVVGVSQRLDDLLNEHTAYMMKHKDVRMYDNFVR